MVAGGVNYSWDYNLQQLILTICVHKGNIPNILQYKTFRVSWGQHSLSKNLYKHMKYLGVKLSTFSCAIVLPDGNVDHLSDTLAGRRATNRKVHFGAPQTWLFIVDVWESVMASCWKILCYFLLCLVFEWSLLDGAVAEEMSYGGGGSGRSGGYGSGGRGGGGLPRHSGGYVGGRRGGGGCWGGRPRHGQGPND